MPASRAPARLSATLFRPGITGRRRSPAMLPSAPPKRTISVLSSPGPARRPPSRTERTTPLARAQWRRRPWRPDPEARARGCRSGEATRVAAAEAVAGVAGDHHVVVAVPVDRPADGLGAASLHGHRPGAALVVVPGQGVGDVRLAVVGQLELDLPAPQGGLDARD